MWQPGIATFFPCFTGERVSFSSGGKSQLAADYVVYCVNQVQRQKPDSWPSDLFPGAWFVQRCHRQRSGLGLGVSRATLDVRGEREVSD